MSEEPSDDLEYAREILTIEARAVELVRDRLGPSFLAALDLLGSCRGQVVVTGVGKSGLIGQKISATLASTGTPSFYLHSSEAFHGDLGRVREHDVVLALSHSGETEDLVRLVPLLRRIGVPLIAVTSDPESRLGREADVVLATGSVDEAGALKMAPTSSTTATLALGDALALAASRRRRFTLEEYALFHRGGALGRQLLRVREIMRSGDRLPAVSPSDTVRAALARISGPGGRNAGAALVVDAAGILVGIFTDGDLRRHLESGTAFLDRPVEEVMTRRPKAVGLTTLVAEAQKLMKTHRIDEVPVVDDAGRPLGVLDIQDLLEVGFAL
ncbi:MAG: KpsF/GutQ family sugar-phosphate isomerase [Planctomycetes bacterium]|jgi:arabinose-5-phosphate isomerase|nr:KpsF/GutQ family sugar-phosphate isomerase [Planctomycetota bacterium]